MCSCFGPNPSISSYKLLLKVKYSTFSLFKSILLIDHTIYCGLIIDEIAIRHHVEWDGNKYHGYVNFGTGFSNEKSDIATECFVFMLVAINESWKIPVGYFLCNHLNSSQKSELIQQCLNLVNKIGIKVVSLTFDGCASNINMSKLLGCNLDPTSFKTNFVFKLTDSLTQNIAIFPDPAHMVKLVRNTLGEKKILIDGDNNTIKFDYLEKLLILQESEGLHLANKLKKQHIYFFQTKNESQNSYTTIEQICGRCIRVL